MDSKDEPEPERAIKSVNATSHEGECVRDYGLWAGRFAGETRGFFSISRGQILKKKVVEASAAEEGVANDDQWIRLPKKQQSTGQPALD